MVVLFEVSSSTAGSLDSDRRTSATKKGRKRKCNPPPPPSVSEPLQQETPTEARQEEGETIEKFLEALAKKSLVALVKEAVHKYGDPEYIQSIRHVADLDPAMRKICVEVYGKACFNAETLTSVYGEYGEIENYCFLDHNWYLAGTSRLSARAHILFKHRYGARKVLKIPQITIGKDTYAVSMLASLIGDLAHPRRFTSDFRFRGGAQSALVVEEPGENLIDLFGKDCLVKLVTEAISRYPDFIKSLEKQVSLDPTPRRVEVFCQNLPTVLPALASFYGKYGEIEECTATYGCANILYKNRNSAREALKDPKPTAGMNPLPWCRPGPEVVYHHIWKLTGESWSWIPPHLTRKEFSFNDEMKSLKCDIA